MWEWMLVWFDEWRVGSDEFVSGEFEVRGDFGKDGIGVWDFGLL
jgi:hypothetical protein